MPNDKEINIHKAWLEQLSDCQTSELDQREQARDADHFLLDKDGQWELHVSKTLDSQGRPRYTFDKVTPVIESIMGDIEDMDFSVQVKPQGGGANKENALFIEGLIRTIENNCGAVDTYRKAIRRVIRRGFDAFEVKSVYLDEWSFEQDLVIESIPNAVNRVWLDNTSTKQDGSDNEFAYVLTSMSPADYKKQWPKGAGVSVSDSETHQQYEENYQPEVITVGKKYYKKPRRVEVIQMSNGEVIENNDENAELIKSLKDNGVFEKKKKMIDDFKVYCQYFDGSAFLEPEMETVFKSIPVIPVYGNHEIMGHNSKLTYSGIVLKLMDAQRVHNYGKSREIEEGALAPRTKFWMTKKQAQGHEPQLAKMNLSADPVQFYNQDDNAPPPYQSGANQVNPHLSTLGNQMAQDINAQASVFSAMKGDFPGRASEDAIRQMVDRGQAATRKWVNSLTIAIKRAGDIMLEAIPVVYDTRRQVQITGLDGTETDAIANDVVFDQASGKAVPNNDLNKGKYKVTVDAGAAFSNKMEAGLNALLEYAKIDGTLPQIGGDIILKAIDAPLVDKVAERKREMMIKQGLIPESQMTDDEKQQAQQIQQAQAQNAQNDPNTILARAEEMKGQAEMQRQKNEQVKVQLDIERLQNEKIKLAQDMQNSHMDNMQKAANVDKTVADTAKSWAAADNLQGDTVNKHVDSLDKMRPEITIVAHQPEQ